jgi:hypothetical protein
VKKKRAGFPALGSGGYGRLRPAPAARDRGAGHLRGAVVAEIGLLRAAAGIREVDAHHGATTFGNFLRTIVTNKTGHPGQWISSSKRIDDTFELTAKGTEIYAAARD